MVDPAPAPPMINVRTLAAFGHCPNAGRISHLQAADNEEPSYDRVANLSYTPKFEYAYLLERERRCRFPALYWTVLIGAELMFVWLMFSTGRWGYALSLLAAMAPSVYFSRFDLYEYWCICQQILDYWTAPTRPLPECTDHPVAIDWWSLVKSGLTPGKTDDYVHSELGLRGKHNGVITE